MASRVGEVLTRPVRSVGRSAIGFVEEFGKVVRVLMGGLLNLFRRPLRIRLTIEQLDSIGVQSLAIIVLSAAFTGGVFTLQSVRAFILFGAEGYAGGTVGVALAKELGPTLTGLLVAGRCGSSMAAELGTMRVTEQIDALEAMAVDPINYLVKPRLLASMIALPMLTAVFDAVGMAGAWAAAWSLGVSQPAFFVRLQEWVDWDDIAGGLFKAFVFGMIIGTVGCYKGFYTKGGAAGVGRATTSAVVVSSVAILVANYIIAWQLP